MGKNNSKRKPRTEFSRITSIMVKLDNQNRTAKDIRKAKKGNKNEKSRDSKIKQ